MKIALISTGIPPYVVGGMQRHSLNLARYLGRLSVPVDLYRTDMRRGANKDTQGDSELLNSEPFTAIPVPWPPSGRLPGHYVRELKAYSKLVLQKYSQGQAADFIYAQGITGLAFLKAKKSGAKLPPIGVNCHGYEMFQRATDFRTFLEQGLMRPSFKTCSRLADVAFSFGGIFPELLTNTIGVQKERIAVVPNAIESDWISAEAPARHQCFRFIFVGRNERRKGIADLNQVLLQANLADCEFHFVGDIPKPDQISQPNVRYHGKVTDDAILRTVLDASDCLVCPSYAEGMPTVILEAMARGLTIIATDVGAVREMVGPDNGILMSQPGAKHIQKAMEAMLAMPAEQIQTLKQKSLEKVKQFTWDRVAQMTLEKISEKV